jgi:hypothetical protein
MIFVYQAGQFLNQIALNFLSGAVADFPDDFPQPVIQRSGVLHD